MESVKVVTNIIRALGAIPKRMEEYLRNTNAGIELAALNSKNSVSGISKVVCSSRSDRGDTTKRCEKKKKKKKQPRGWGRGESASSLPLFLLIFFSLPSFASHSTIRKPGTGYQQRSSEDPWRRLVAT